MNSILHNLDWVLPLRSEFATLVLSGFTWTIYTPFILTFLPLGYWLWNKHVFTRLTVLVMISAVLNSLLKDYFQDPRPDVFYRIDSRVGNSFGLPSGHAQTAVVLWFWLAYETRRFWLLCVAVIMVIGVAFSRLYLGVHDLEDVLGGGAIGIGCLLLYGFCLSPLFDPWRNLNPFVRIVAVFVVEAVLYYFLPKDSSIVVILYGGFLWGWFSGAAIERKYLDFKVKPAPFKLLAAGSLGMVTIAFLPVLNKLGGFGWSIPTDAFLSYVVAAIVGATISVALPFLFCLFRLADASSRNRNVGT